MKKAKTTIANDAAALNRNRVENDAEADMSTSAGHATKTYIGNKRRNKSRSNLNVAATNANTNAQRLAFKVKRR